MKVMAGHDTGAKFLGSNASHPCQHAQDTADHVCHAMSHLRGRQVIMAMQGQHSARGPRSLPDQPRMLTPSDAHAAQGFAATVCVDDNGGEGMWNSTFRCNTLAEGGIPQACP